MTLTYDEQALQIVRERRLLIDQVDRWLFDEFAPFIGQRVLEIGCGLGNVLRLLTDRELVLGIDVSADSVASLNRVYSNIPNVSAKVASITDPAVLHLKHYNFDTALSINVFEHIENDLVALQNTSALLGNVGRFVLVVPAHEWLYGTMDRSIGHYRRYAKASLADKLRQAGFRVERQKYINAVGALGWFMNGRILKQRVPPSGQLKLFNLIVPVLQRFESIFSPPFGVSLLTIASKTEFH